MRKIAEGAAQRISELVKAGLRADRIAMVGGPAESPLWPDILRKAIGLEISLPEIGSYAGALGAAMLASGEPSPP
jgi:sugar (pentulose or hexulose) kinase